MQKRNKAVPANFVFTMKQVLCKIQTEATIQVCVRRKDKAVYSREVSVMAESTYVLINDRMDFPTTIEYDNERGGYKSKSAQLQLKMVAADGRTYQSSTELELTEFVGSEPLLRRLKLQGELPNVTVQFTCSCELPEANQMQKFNSMANLQTGTIEVGGVLPEISKQREQNVPEKSQKTLGLAPRRKEKTLLLIPEAPCQESAVEPNTLKITTDGIEAKRGVKRAMTTTFASSRPFSFGAERGAQQQNGQQFDAQVLPSMKKSPPKQHGIEQNRPLTVTIIEDSQPKRQKKDIIPSINNFKSSTSIDCKMDTLKVDDSELRQAKETVRKLRDELKQVEKESKIHEQANNKLLRQIKELTEKVETLESSERNSEEGKQKMVKRLYEDIDTKNKQLKTLEAECQGLRSRMKSEEDDAIRLKKQLSDLKLQRERLLLEAKTKVLDPTAQNKEQKKYQRQLERLRKEYDQQIKELKEQLKQASLPTTAEATTSNHEICLSKECQQAKKELKAKLKAQTKTLEEKEKQLETKERLIKNYESIKKDRQVENSSINFSKELEKWRAERLVLEQQIEDLQRARDEPTNKRPSDELLTYKVEKENLSKELERTRRNLNQLTKEKENLEISSKQKEQAILKAKQEVVNLLNAVQEHGGMELYEAICNVVL